MPEHIDKGLQSGFFDYVTKPIELQKLFLAMEKATDKID
jgi:response regulator of citrate/malate metabolism